MTATDHIARTSLAGALRTERTHLLLQRVGGSPDPHRRSESNCNGIWRDACVKTTKAVREGIEILGQHVEPKELSECLCGAEIGALRRSAAWVR